MKFESQFGLGEIVATKQLIREGYGIRQDNLGEVIGITFGLDGTQNILVRLDNGVAQAFMAAELNGDPAFDQEQGRYIDNPEG